MAEDLRGKWIIITGGSSGIGAAGARILTERGADVVITGRSEQTQKLAAEIGCDAYTVDYESFAAVSRFAEQLLERYGRIDILVNNVGGIIGDRRITEDGHEATLQVNHLSGFLLTNLLRERLRESSGIVINTSSATNRMGNIDFSDLENEKEYNAFRAYATAKMMNILHAIEVDRRFDSVHAASFHPGGVSTGFAREGRGIIRWIYETPLRHLFLITPEKGADTLIWLVEREPGKDWSPGEYYDKRKPGRRSAQVQSAIAERLWAASEALISSSVK